MNKTVLFLLTIFLVVQACAQKNIISVFVAPDGKENASGSIDHPLDNLPTAIKKADAIVKTRAGAVTSVQIYLREGVYYVSNTIELTEGSTWTSAVPLTITACNDENVVLHGGKVLPKSLLKKIDDSNFIKRLSPQFADKIRQVDLKKAGIEDIGKLHSTGFSQPFVPAALELFLNSHPGRVARWPNHGSILIDKLLDSGSIPRRGDTTKRGGTFTYAGTNRPSRWKEPAKSWLYGFFMWGYADEAVPLKTIDTITKTITTALPSTYGFGTGKPWRSWYAYNLPEEIDTTGEYYIDADRKLLYFMLPDILERVEVSMLETPVIALEGVKNVAIKNITITCSRGMGIYMERTEHVRIKGCTFSNLGMMAISMGKGVEPPADGQQVINSKPALRMVGNLAQYVYENSTYDGGAGFDNGIIDCDVFQTGAGGIFLSGGNRLTLQPGRNFIQNCRITAFNRLERTQRPGIWISGVGNRIINCEIFNAPSLAVLLHGNDHLLEYNNIHHVALEVDDMSAFYYGRDPSEQGSIIRNNYFHHIGGSNKTMAIYHDDGACGMTVYNNIFFKAGTVAGFIGGGRDNKYTNNIFIDTKFASHIDDRLNNWASAMLQKDGLFEKRLKAVNYQYPPYSIKYPHLEKYFSDEPALPKRDTFSLNVFVNVDTIIEVPKTRSELSRMLTLTNDNLYLRSDPGFVSYAHEDFRLKKDSEVFKKLPGFKQIPVGKIGCHLYKKRGTKK